ncbi:hypothetical protein J6590_026063 [Homalodisca vitripennis]|nr:hypothetical protein J6590_026063 [Homalodisca vitripennis]
MIFRILLGLSFVLLLFLPLIFGTEEVKVAFRTIADVDDQGVDLVSSKDIADVCETLRTLDESLTKMLTDPPVDGGEELMKELRTYNQACLHLLNHCLEDKGKAFTAAKDMLERGGPEFLDIDINEDQLEQRFQWEKDALENMQNARKKTNILWYDLWRIYNKVPLTK